MKSKDCGIAISILTLLASLSFNTFNMSAQAKGAVGDDEIRQQMIEDSLASYPGNCPCPYNSMRNGRACGGRSAYSRPGGYSPLCYKEDISDSEVQQFKASHTQTHRKRSQP